MVLVTGGAFCGKSHFIKEKYNVCDEQIISGELLFAKKELREYRVIENFEKYIEIILKNDEDADVEAEAAVKLEELYVQCNDIVIEIREMGAGIVPVDKFERKYREAVGRCACIIANKCDSMYRVVCGIAMKIK